MIISLYTLFVDWLSPSNIKLKVQPTIFNVFNKPDEHHLYFNLISVIVDVVYQKSLIALFDCYETADIMSKNHMHVEQL